MPDRRGRGIGVGTDLDDEVAGRRRLGQAAFDEREQDRVGLVSEADLLGLAVQEHAQARALGLPSCAQNATPSG